MLCSSEPRAAQRNEADATAAADADDDDDLGIGEIEGDFLDFVENENEATRPS